MTDYASPINIFHWQGTRLRDKENLFLSLLQRGKLNHARKTGAFWQNALREAIGM
jgi:hypothetical protein